MSEGFHYSRARNTYDNTPVQLFADDFDQFSVLILSDQAATKGKQNIAAPFRVADDTEAHRSTGKDRNVSVVGKHHRCALCVEPRRFIALDLDEVESPEAFADLQGWFAIHQVSAFGWTTHSHEPDAIRARFIIETDRTMDREECIAASSALRHRLNVALGGEEADDRFGFDAALDRPEQPIFLPPKTGEHFTYAGKPLSVDELLEDDRAPRKLPASHHGVAVASFDGGEVIETDRHAYVLKRSLMLAAGIRSGHLTRDDAMLVMVSERDNGRYSRHVPEEEIARALDGAIAKVGHTERFSADQLLCNVPALNNDAHWGFVFADEMIQNLGPTLWLVQKLIPEDSIGVLYGASGCFKSFVMLDMALSIANGVPWQQKATKQRTVYYLAGEGEQGFAKRIAAWCAARGLPPSPMFAFRQIPRIQDADELSSLVDAIRHIAAERGQAGLIVIDTLFTALDGGDENSGKDMGQIIAAMKRLRVEFKAAIYAVHHTGKQGESARGHSSLSSGMDVMLFAKAGPAPLTVEITNPKQKDGTEHPSMLLQASVHELPIIGEDGVAEASLVLSGPAFELLASYESRSKRTEETIAKAQVKLQLKKDAEDQIKEHALYQFTQGATLQQVVGEVEELAQQLGFPDLARAKSTLACWKKEAGL